MRRLRAAVVLVTMISQFTIRPSFNKVLIEALVVIIYFTSLVIPTWVNRKFFLVMDMRFTVVL